MIVSSVVAANSGIIMFCGISGMGCGLFRKVIIVPSVVATIVPEAIVV